MLALLMGDKAVGHLMVLVDDGVLLDLPWSLLRLVCGLDLVLKWL